MELRLLRKIENLSLWSLATRISLSSNSEALDFFFILESYSGGPILAFIGCRTGDRLEYLSSANMSDELSQSSDEPILAFIGCKIGGKPNR